MTRSYLVIRPTGKRRAGIRPPSDPSGLPLGVAGPCDVDEPRGPELVGEHPERVAPRRRLELLADRRALGQLLPVAPQLGVVLGAAAQRHRAVGSRAEVHVA